MSRASLISKPPTTNALFYPPPPPPPLHESTEIIEKPTQTIKLMSKIPSRRLLFQQSITENPSMNPSDSSPQPVNFIGGPNWHTINLSSQEILILRIQAAAPTESIRCFDVLLIRIDNPSDVDDALIRQSKVHGHVAV